MSAWWMESAGESSAEKSSDDGRERQQGVENVDELQRKRIARIVILKTQVMQKVIYSS